MIIVSSFMQDGNYFYKEAERLLQNSMLHLTSLSVYSQQCYDATWTLALGLNDSITSEWLVCVCMYITDVCVHVYE